MRLASKRLLTALALALLIYGLFTLLPKPFPSPDASPLAPTPTASSSAVLGQSSLVLLPVNRVIDGDTIEINVNGLLKKVRFIGIDTPETVDPRRPVGCFGKEASNETKGLLEGKSVSLEKDVSETDKFNRLLRLVYLKLPDGNTLFINDYLVREGFAKASTYPPDVKFSAQFLQAQRAAQAGNKGLWGKCQ